MSIGSVNLATMVFKSNPSQNVGNVSIDGTMLNILMALDGETQLGDIVRIRGLDLKEGLKAVARLLDLKLIEPNHQAIPTLDEDFLGFLLEQLSQAVGPIAEILIEDTAEELGHDMAAIPTHQAAELIDLLGREIKREEQNIRFKQHMVNKIREKGY